MIYKLELQGEKIAVANLPLSQWTVVTPSTVQISGNSIINTGSGGWVESAYVSFTVPTTGSYTVSYDYDFANGYVGNWAYYGFGLFISPNGPPPQDSWTYYENSSNRVGYVLANPSTSIAGWKGTVTFTTTLNAGTTYYLWFPGGALNDGVTYTLTFKNIAIYNDPIQYTPSRDIKFNGTRVTYDYTAPSIIVPSDMDFIYFANDFDGSKIPNSAPNSSFGDYLKQGSLTLNGSGSSAYLSNGLSASNYLYKDLTNDQLNAMKATNSTYSFFFRVMQDQNAMGGIISWRSGNSYIYMIRGENYQVQIHTDSGTYLGDNFRLDTDRVYKIVVNGSTFKAYNLDNNADYTLTYSTNRTMTSRMATFNADRNSSGEAKLSRFYALAGIPRATTSEEDANIKAALMNQKITRQN